jgi:hypothetical protein
MTECCVTFADQPVRRQSGIAFADEFPFDFDGIALLPEYEIPDDDSIMFSKGNDGEIRQTNPFEIHGKVVPLWARQDALQRQMETQCTIDPDDVFAHMHTTCCIEKMFARDRQM